MKKYIISVISALTLTLQVFTQGGVSISTTGTTADPSAALDIQYNNKGLLIPRMTINERNSIVNPAEGLQIFNTSTKCFEYFAYGIWQTGNCATCPLPDDAGAISGTASVCQGQSSVSYSVPVITNATSYIWACSGTGVTINGTSNSITIDFAANATSGNLTVKGNNQCGDGNISPDFAITVNTTPTGPIAGAHTPSATEIIWSWNAVAGATGYKYNTTNDYLSATDNWANTSFTQTGLTCNTAYTIYVWAYNNCGNSSVTVLNQNTSLCYNCGASTVTFTYKGSSVTYGTVSGQNGTCWLDRNLGASNVANSVSDAASYGDLFQWGRADDGHQNRTSTTTTTLSGTDNPGHSHFIKTATSPNDWRNPQNNNLWQITSNTNNPCPAGWRVPTMNEIDNENSSWISDNMAGAFASPLKWSAGGKRECNPSYNLWVVGTYGEYWTSSIQGTSAINLMIAPSAACPTAEYRGAGMSIRCIKD